MVKDQLVRRGIRDERLLKAMGTIARHEFIPAKKIELAYEDQPIGIGKRQTISQPYMVALMTELLELKGDEVVLEIGTGSGYQAAILGYMAKKVYTLERHAELADRAAAQLERIGINNVEVVHADGSLGFPEHAPYNGIIVTAAAPQAPRPLMEQLAEGGRLVVPVGGPKGQKLQCWQRFGDKYNHVVVVPVSFVPLRGKYGWGLRGWRHRRKRNK